MSRDNPEWEIVALQSRLLAANTVMAEAYAVLWNLRQLLKDSNLDREVVYVCSDLMQKILDTIKKSMEVYK